MSFEDEEILQDFLVEAGEILDQLQEQLVDLEQRPSDTDLLNAIFRGFHTVKGGAGFLQLDALVECCHVTENLFDILRQGKREATPDLMDVVLQALDSVNEMFAEVKGRQEPSPAPRDLLQALENLVAGNDSVAVVDEPAPVPASVVEPAADTVLSAAIDGAELFDTAPQPAGQPDITDEEFEQFLDAIQDPPTAAQTGTPSSSPAAVTSTTDTPASASQDEISEDEFEALLDQIHGKGQFSASQNESATSAADTGAELFDSAPVAEDTGAELFSSPAPAGSGAGGTGDEITEDEFEALLDQLHGKGKHSGAPEDVTSATPAPAEVPAAAAEPVAKSAGGDLITDDEFEALLDQLHGKGKSPSEGEAATAEVAAPAPAAPPAKPVSKPAPASVETPAPVAAEASAPAAVAETKAPAKPSRMVANNRESPTNTIASETTVRVDTQRLDDIMNMVGELVLVRNRLVRLGAKSGDEEMNKAVSNLDVVTADLQTSVMKTRMQPIKKVFGRFPRVVRDLARNLKKEISLELEGEETDLDKNLVEALADPLVHLVRNAVDHGIEMPSERETIGKPRVGRIVLAAEQEGDHILLSITDDGRGMDPEKLRSIAIEKGVLDRDAAERLTDTECYDLIFAPGFSTKKEISDVSGRGVGMDVVKTKITQLNGSIEIQSKLGEGSRLVIKVPLTLAIMPTLMVMLGEQTFALPLVSVNEIFHMDLTRTNIVDGQEVITVREKALPLFHLKRWLVQDIYGDPTPSSAHVVIVSVGTQRVGFVVDQLIGQEEVVIKPLGKMLHGTPGMAGATITGDGRIALILDVPSMLKRYAG